MNVSLLRHGIAEDHGASDRARALTRAGSVELERVLDALCARGDWAPRSILYSPYVRTTQTAEAVARRFPEARMQPFSQLAGDDLDTVFAGLAEARTPLLVGHMPLIGALLAYMIGEPLHAMTFERAGFAHVAFDRAVQPGAGRLLLHVGPSALLARG